MQKGPKKKPPRKAPPRLHVQIRGVPEALHRTLCARAAARGLSLSDFLLRELEKLGSRPTMEEWVARVRSHEPVEGLDVAAIMDEIRGARP
jgi:hypothetical protein